MIEGEFQIRNENEGCNLLKKALEIASFTKLHSNMVGAADQSLSAVGAEIPNLIHFRRPERRR